MKSIEIAANGTKAQFSTKSITIDGKEYLYTEISNIKHSTPKHLYLFQYEGKWCKLDYDEKEEQKLKMLFEKIAKLNSQRAKQAEPAADQAVTPAQSDAAVKPVPETVAEAVSETTTEAPAPVQETQFPLEETVTEPVQTPVETAAQTSDVPDMTPAEAFIAEEEAEAFDEVAEEKRSRFKKSIIVFVIIIAIFAIAAVAYFFVIGPSSNPNIGPNSDGTQQYNDIDELIEDLE